MALDADFQHAIVGGSCHAQDDVTIIELSVVERHLGLLVDRSADKFCSAGDAAAIFATVREIDPLCAQTVEQGLFCIDIKSCVVAVGEGDGMGVQSQISDVQSPPG